MAGFTLLSATVPAVYEDPEQARDEIMAAHRLSTEQGAAFAGKDDRAAARAATSSKAGDQPSKRNRAGKRPEHSSTPELGSRVVIENVQPRVEGDTCNQFAVKRCVGDAVEVTADIFADGHDVLAAKLLYRSEDELAWSEAPMELHVNDRWRGEFSVRQLGRYLFTIEAWVDHFASWRRDFRKKVEAGQAAAVDLFVGAQLIDDVMRSAHDDDDADQFRGFRDRLRKLASGASDSRNVFTTALKVAEDEQLGALIDRWAQRGGSARFEHELLVEVDRERARFSTWYEVFPRSCSQEPGRHGTLRDLEARLPYIASMGFDVLYLPPIHPIGTTNRKGRNNATRSQPDDVGSPWAIGSHEGGHKAIHPELGTMDDFHHLTGAANEHGMEIALDVAFQCSPDHPYLKGHPEWFRHRPDGTLQYAENPPKKYEDIYPFDFETDAWESLWRELFSIFEFWIGHGVKIFRVDNPHTKSLPFWKWCIREIKSKHPDVILLSEAFTRPKVMKRLAKLGFTQSYTYFAWKNTSHELREYFEELTQGDMIEYFRPNVWPNTPDILNEYLQHGGRAAFMARLVLAATLAASYGIYGPAFELCEHVPREPGSEEYLDSEKYQLRHWNLDHPDSLREFIARVNRLRRENAALQSDRTLLFHNCDNQQIISYSKRTSDLSNIIIAVVNLDPYHTHSGWIEVPLDELELDEHATYQVHDLLTDAHYPWRGRWNYVELNPYVSPAHVFSLKRRVRTEQEFEYFA